MASASKHNSQEKSGMGGGDVHSQQITTRCETGHRIQLWPGQITDLLWPSQVSMDLLGWFWGGHKC